MSYPLIEIESFDGYCPACDRINDKHAEDCRNWGTTEEERAAEAKADAKAERAEYEYDRRREEGY